MNKKGQVNVGVIIVAFVTIVVGVALLVVVAQQVGQTRDTVAIVNRTLGVADNATTVYITDIRSISDIVIYNESGTEIVPANNYTVTNNVVNEGALAVSVLPDGSNNLAFQGYTWTISGTAQPLTYVSDGGSRSIVTLIVIFFALAIAVAALYPVMKDSILQYFS